AGARDRRSADARQRPALHHPRRAGQRPAPREWRLRGAQRRGAGRPLRPGRLGSRPRRRSPPLRPAPPPPRPPPPPPPAPPPPAPVDCRPGGVPGGTDYLTLSPALKQVFWIGDGRTDAGELQQVFVPAGATRLYLGTMDTLSWHDNSGSFAVDLRPFDPATA